MSDDKLTPERAVRLLRAKAGELERHTRDSVSVPTPFLAADIALVASLLADHIERAAQPPAEAVDTGYWQGGQSDG